MQRKMVWLTDRQAAAVAREAKKRDLPQSEIIREMIEDRYGLAHEIVEAGRKYAPTELVLAQNA